MDTVRAFGRQIIFGAGTPIEGSHGPKALTVSPDLPAAVSGKLQHQSPWMPMSGRDIRFVSEKNFPNYAPGVWWGLEVRNVALFAWQIGGQCIAYRAWGAANPALVQYWVLHTLLPVLLTLEGGTEILHAGAVEVDGRRIAFSAPSCGGKSTLTGYCLERGAMLLSDDALAIVKRDGHYLCLPGSPYYRPYRATEVLGQRADKVACGPAPVDAIYCLQPVAADAPVSVQRLGGAEKFAAMHLAGFLHFSFLKPQRLQFLGEFLHNVPVYNLDVPWEPGRLDEVYATVISS